jgi:hypothetical protein
MAVDAFVAYGGVYSDLAHAEADYELVKDLHTQAGLLDAYDAGLVVVGVSDMGARIEQAMQHADKLQSKELRADTAEIERDAEAAGADQAPAGNC